MHHHYEDIRDLIPEQPKWYDEFAIPRYCDFATNKVANIYADEIALVEIECQECEHPFLVAFSRDASWATVREAMGCPTGSIANSIRDKSLHYGDPPNINCCAAGPTMNCNDIRVVEYWRRARMFDWERDSSFEIALADG